MDPTVVEQLARTTVEVFETMVFKTAVRQAVTEDLPTSSGPHVAATVAFAGERTGLVAFHCTPDTARSIAGSMLGIPASDVGHEIADAMGELANMIAGGLRLKMKSDGVDVAISIPTVITGSDFRTRYVTPVDRVVCPFRLDHDATVSVELILNP